MNAKPISEDSESTWKSIGCVIIFGLIFLVVGMSVFIGMQLIPWLSSRAAMDWQEVPCTIVSSEVEEHRGDENTSYSVEANYTYEIDGQTFSSDQYDFNSVKRARKKCKEIVRLLPAGKKTVCFVDPDAPENAVLNREFLMSWLVLILGGVFSAIGAGISIGLPLTMGRRKEKKQTVGSQTGVAAANGLQPSNGTSIGLYEEDVEDQKWDVPQRLKPTMTRIGQLVGLICLAAFWNGIVGMLSWQTIVHFKWDFFSVFGTLFMIPFIIIGILMILGVVKAFFSLFNPVFEIAMSTGAIARGKPVDVAWEIKGNANRIKRLRIVAVGNETAVYQQGTSTATATSAFGLIPIADTTVTEEISFGSQAVTIPADAMHTFADQHNKITWSIHVRADIARFPDVFQTHTFRVKP